MDILGIQKDLDQTKAALTTALDRIAQLEAQTARDVSTIAKQVLDGLAPMVKASTDAVNTMTLTVNAAATELLGTARRINGASIKFELGPEDQ